MNTRYGLSGIKETKSNYSLKIRSVSLQDIFNIVVSRNSIIFYQSFLRVCRFSKNTNKRSKLKYKYKEKRRNWAKWRRNDIKSCGFGLDGWKSFCTLWETRTFWFGYKVRIIAQRNGISSEFELNFVLQLAQHAAFIKFIRISFFLLYCHKCHTFTM